METEQPDGACLPRFDLAHRPERSVEGQAGLRLTLTRTGLMQVSIDKELAVATVLWRDFPDGRT